MSEEQETEEDNEAFWDRFRERYEKELSEIKIDEELADSLVEIVYAMYQASMIDYKHDTESASDVLRLVELAKKYKDGLPEEMQV